MTRFGYGEVQTPLIEFSDLFLTKAGDESVSRLFNFELHGRQLCLRPEFTASAARLYVERYQHEPKPIRWQFAGPVFRYESPRRNFSRQYTSIGAELIGSSGVSGEAETIGLAASGLTTLGIKDWSITIGHVGLVSQLLDQFPLDRRMRRTILGHIENLRRRGRDYVETAIKGLYGGIPTPITEAFQSGESMEQALEVFLRTANLTTMGAGRSQEDVARRLISKQQRINAHADVSRALDFLESLVRVEGTPEVAFAALEPLIPDDAALRRTVESFRATLDLLPAYGIAPERIHIEMGLARGLNYYTGIVFELQAGDNALGGGGRYDDLIRLLGAGQDTPAIGFAYNVDRILSELNKDSEPTPTPNVHVLVVPVSEADNAAAARIAMQCRTRIHAELYTPPTRNLSQALSKANKDRTPYVIIVGEAERESEMLSVRDMAHNEQFTCTVDELLERINARD
jgi:histidyl-tRNA synthetase